MSEKLLGVHTKPLHLRVLARLPVCECVWFQKGRLQGWADSVVISLAATRVGWHVA